MRYLHGIIIIPSKLLYPAINGTWIVPFSDVVISTGMKGALDLTSIVGQNGKSSCNHSCTK